MPFATIPEAQPVTRRDRRLIAVAGVILLAIFAGVAIWAAVRPGSYGASRNGCITVSVPSTTGGALLHGWELQFSLTNTASSSAASVGADQALSAIVSYHLTRHVALGVRTELHRHSGTPVVAQPNATSVLRLRLDVTQ